LARALPPGGLVAQFRAPENRDDLLHYDSASLAERSLTYPSCRSQGASCNPPPRFSPKDLGVLDATEETETHRYCPRAPHQRSLSAPGRVDQADGTCAQFRSRAASLAHAEFAKLPAGWVLNSGLQVVKLNGVEFRNVLASAGNADRGRISSN